MTAPKTKESSASRPRSKPTPEPPDPEDADPGPGFVITVGGEVVTPTTIPAPEEG
jgi:hypothetical protein